jgi:hypothetical protein
LKPGGNFSLSIGISPAAVTVIFPGIGAKVEEAISGPMPCFHAGAAGAGAISALGGGEVAQPCKIIKDIARVESVETEISRWVMVNSILFLSKFIFIVSAINLIVFLSNGYSLVLGFCLTKQ